MRTIRSRWLSWRGDTIVEVMVSMSVLGLVMGVAFVTSRHSLQSGLQSAYRDQADSYARQQVELIKKLDAGGSLIGYQDSEFCINPSGAAKQSVNSSTHLCSLPIGSATPSQYSLVDKYNSSTKIYTIEVQWPSSTAGSPNQITLQYKARNSFVNTPGAFNPPTSGSTTAPPPDWLSFTTDRGDNPTVQSGTSMNLRWATIPSADKCNGSGVPGTWNSGDKPGNGTFAITPTSTVTYTLTCYSGGASSSKQQTVTVYQVPPTIAFSASPTQLGLRFNSAGPTGGNCLRILESADYSGTWYDNYLCWPTNENLGLSWTSAGPTNAGITNINGQICLNTFEGADPDTWWDNYLCSPRDYGFRWSSAGPLSGMYCTQWYESADLAQTWGDNYLCEPTNSAVNLSWSATNATSCNSSWGGSISASGSAFFYGLTRSTAYTVTCTGPGGGQSKSQTVNVGPIDSQPSCAGPYCSPPPPPAPAAYLCQDAYFDTHNNPGGYGTCWGPFPDGYNCNWAPNCGVPNDTVSSFKAVNGVLNVASYWDWNYGGACANFPSNDGWIGNYWNDQISSFKVGSYC